MYTNRSPPKYNKLAAGGSSSAASSLLLSPTSSSSSPTAAAATTATVISSTTVAVARSPSLNAQQQQHSAHSTCRPSSSASSLSLYSSSSSSALLQSAGERSQHSHYHHHHHHHSHHHGGGGGGGSGGGGGGVGRNGASLSSGSMKRGKKQNWGTRERAGMSFLIVIAFFAVFGLIILTEVFMIDERSHGGMMVLRHGGSLGGRLGDSMPDYDNAKDDYDLLDENLLNDNKLGFVQFQDNKLKIQGADSGDGGRLAGVLLNSGTNGVGAAVAGGAGGGGAGGGGGGGGGVNSATIPWGKVLPAKVEETLPHYPIGTPPTDGSWQVVNGTRFKFFVFSAYYDRRDGSKLVRVIGATKTRGPERVFCRFWYLNRNASATEGGGGGGQRARYTSATVMARVKVIRENWNLKYSACFVLCPVRGSELDVPHYVSIVLRLRAPPGNLLELRNTDWDPDFAAANRNAPNSTATGGGSSAASVSQPAATTGALPTGEQIADKIAICVKPFHFNYDQALYLMEYLEFYALLGVAHFTFYNHTIGPHATCVLQHYMDGDVPGNLTAWDLEPQTPAQSAAAAEAAAAATGTANSSAYAAPPPLRRFESANYAKPTINILPWNLRMRSQKEIRTEGLFAALNDCLYRTMYRYKYLALVDLDEFIVPRHNDTLNELINSLNGRFRNRNTGAYSFQNAFFYLQFADDPLVTQYTPSSANPRVRAALVTQRKTRRRFKLHPQKQRSKYICKPEAVVEAGNHFVWEFSPGKGSLNVPPTDAILQHYRVCEFGGNDCIKAPSIVDRTANKYVNRLVQRVDAVYRYLKGRCDLPDLPVLTTQAQPPPPSEENKRSNNEAQETKTNNDRVARVAKATTKTATTTTRMKTATTTTTRMTTSSITKTKAKVSNSSGSTLTTTSTTTKRETTDSGGGQGGANLNRKHKMIVFEERDDGLMKAKVQFVDNK